MTFRTAYRIAVFLVLGAVLGAIVLLAVVQTVREAWDRSGWLGILALGVTVAFMVAVVKMLPQEEEPTELQEQGPVQEKQGQDTFR